MGEIASLLPHIWKEEHSIPTPIRRRKNCFIYKVSWELDHICRGKDKRHIIEVHYDSEDEEVSEDALIDAYLD
jgi:hypothetical protein